MLKKISPVILAVFLISMMACGLATTPEVAAHATSAPLSSPTNLPVATEAKLLPTPTVPLVSTPTPVLVPTISTPVPAATQPPAPSALPGLSAGVFTDDRSTAGSLIISLFNAVNRHEYLRAYSYWQNPAATLGTFNSFATGYANTASVDLAIGTISGDAGAGQLYFTVPVIIKGTATNGQKANYAACYIIHQSQPSFQGTPPFAPMSIVRAKAKTSSLSASDSDALAGACGGADYPISTPLSGSLINPVDVTATNYLDNRSGPVEIVSSLLNALNRKEYVRAYSYWQNPASTLGPYAAYANGYHDTNTITVSFGEVTIDTAGGPLDSKIPLVMKVLTISGDTQTFVGCYGIHFPQPGSQISYPFEPLEIRAGQFKQVDNKIDPTPLIATACNWNK